MERIDPKSAALVIQDLQNDTITEGGAFAESGAPAHAKSQNVVENVKGLAEACRRAGVPVIHVWYIVEQGAPGLKQNAPLFQGVKEANGLVRGTWGAAPADGLEPQEGDHVVEKMRMNGFYDTRLDILLRGLGVETLVITGAWTNMSIEHTARHAADAGYRPLVASDGTSTTSDEWHNAALNYALQNVGPVATCAEIAEALGATPAGYGRPARTGAPRNRPAEPHSRRGRRLRGIGAAFAREHGTSHGVSRLADGRHGHRRRGDDLGGVPAGRARLRADDGGDPGDRRRRHRRPRVTPRGVPAAAPHAAAPRERQA